MAELVVTSGGEERLFRLEEDSVVIGRAPGCAIQIDDIHSSRRHAQVIRVKGGFEVVDLKSRNGTLVNNRKLDRKLLRHEDVVKIGEVEIRYVDPDAVADDDIMLEDVGDSPAPAPAEGACSLQFRGGDRDGASEALTADRTTIGRKPSNAIVLSDAMASSYHCEITRESGGYIIRDLGSTNGTLVNGEMISEMALNHGARIRIGGTRLLFIDPSMAALGAAIDEEDDAGDWGMMREIDATAVPKRGLKLVPILILVIIAAAIGGGFFLMSEDPGAGEARVESPEGNLLAADLYSFEGSDLASAFKTPSGARISTVRGGKTGKQAFKIARGEREGAVVVRYPEAVAVNPERKYRLEGWVKAGPDAVATLRVSWVLRGGVRTPWLVPATPILDGGGFRKASVTVSPPHGAVDLVAQMVLCAGDSATFDDVTITDVGARAPFTKVTSGEFDLQVDEAGVFGISRDRDWVLVSGSFSARLTDGTVLDGGCGLADLSVTGGDSGILVKGAFPRPGGDPVPFSATISAKADLLTFAMQSSVARIGVSLVSEPVLLEEPFYLLGTEVREARLGTFPRTEKLSRLTFGGARRRLGCSAEGDAPVVAAVLEDVGGNLRLGVDVPASSDGKAMLAVRTSFEAQEEEAVDLIREARALADKGAAGEASAIAQKIIVGYSFCENEVRIAEEIAKSMEAQGRIEEERTLRAYESGRDFLDDDALKVAEQMAASLHRSWGPASPRGQKGGELLEKIRELRGKTRVAAARTIAAGELARGQDLAASGKKTLAAAVFRSIVNRFGELPEVEAAVEAKKALAGLTGE